MEVKDEVEYKASINNNDRYKKSLILVAPGSKSNLIDNDTPFWEAEIYPNQSMFFRLIFNLKSKEEINFEIKNNWESFKIVSKEVIENFSKLPDRNNYSSDIKYSVGRSEGKSFINLDVKIESNEKIKVGRDEKSKYRISLDIHIHDDKKNDSYEKIECINGDIHKIIEDCSRCIPASLRQFQGLVEFSNEILINSSVEKDKFKIDKNYPSCLLSSCNESNFSELNQGNYAIQKCLHEKIGGDWYHYGEGYRGFFENEEDRKTGKINLLAKLKELNIWNKEESGANKVKASIPRTQEFRIQ